LQAQLDASRADRNVVPAAATGHAPARTGRPPRLHAGTTQEVAHNERQRESKSLTWEALLHDALFLARWLWCQDV